MRILAVDPGNVESASVLLVDGVPRHPQKVLNAALLAYLRGGGPGEPRPVLAVEMIASYGMAVGREVFETCLWIGRFIETWSAAGGEHRLVYRRDVKLHVCHSARATDSNVRTELLDLYGGREKAIGTKKAPGPLYGMKGDTWSALAVGLTVAEQMRVEQEAPAANASVGAAVG